MLLLTELVVVLGGRMASANSRAVSDRTRDSGLLLQRLTHSFTIIALMLTGCDKKTDDAQSFVRPRIIPVIRALE